MPRSCPPQRERLAHYNQILREAAHRLESGVEALSGLTGSLWACGPAGVTVAEVDRETGDGYHTAAGGLRQLTHDPGGVSQSGANPTRSGEYDLEEDEPGELEAMQALMEIATM